MKLLEAIAHSPCNKAKATYEQPGQTPVTIIVQERYDQQRTWLRTWITPSTAGLIESNADAFDWVAKVKQATLGSLLQLDANHDGWLPIE